jgi:hypothetical protein
MHIPSSQPITNYNFINYLTRNIISQWGYRGDPIFPCPQPVSIERKDFDKLKQHEYFVAVKNDGIRYVMFFTTDKHDRKLCILCDRNMKFSTIKVTVDDNLYHNTLFDGELIEENGSFKFVIYDAVCLCGNHIGKNPFESRLAEIDYCVTTLIKPFENTISIETKPFYKKSDFNTFLEQQYNVESKIDGIIFMPNKIPVLTGTQFSMFKWKTNHTVDFLIKQNGEDLEAYVYNKNELTKFANVKHDTDEGKIFIEKFYSLNPNMEETCILECLFVKEKQNFTPLLIRTDKNYPNSLRTVERTLYNADENVILDEFIELFK